MDENVEKEPKQIVSSLLRHKYTPYAIIVVALLLLGLVGYCTFSKNGVGSRARLSTIEAFDSLVSVLPKGTVIVARFPDNERQDLYYLNSGIMYCFNARSRNLEEIAISGIESGNIANAALTEDEKYIILTVHAGKVDKLYRVNTINKNVVDLDKSVAPTVDESADEEKEKPKVVRQAAPAAPVENAEPSLPQEPVSQPAEEPQPSAPASVSEPEVTPITNE